MKKTKRSLLIGIAAMSLVAASAGAVSTFAWFQANANASVTKNGTETGNVVVGASTASVSNGFTITPSAITAENTLAYTDTSGNTYVSVSNGVGYDKLGASTEAAKVATYTLKATISYSGDLNAQASIQSLWQATVDNVVLRLQCTAVTNDKVAGTPATSDIRFTTGASNYGNSGDSQKSIASSSFTFGSPTGSGPYAAVTGEVTVGTVYVALTGSDSLVVDGTHSPTYTLTVDASLSA